MFSQPAASSKSKGQGARPVLPLEPVKILCLRVPIQESGLLPLLYSGTCFVPMARINGGWQTQLPTHSAGLQVSWGATTMGLSPIVRHYRGTVAQAVLHHSPWRHRRLPYSGMTGAHALRAANQYLGFIKTSSIV